MPNSWRDKARCWTDPTVDPNDFHPEHDLATERAAAEARAKDVCAICPVVDECLAYAIATGSEGIAGKMNRDERLAHVGRARTRATDYNRCACGRDKKKHSEVCASCRAALRRQPAHTR